MSKYAEKVKAWYAGGDWPKSWVRNAVAKGKITAAEYELITGEAYDA